MINLSENYALSELIDNCLAKNNSKIIKILSENNYNPEDSIMIIRTFLSKAKRILKLAIQLEQNNDINKTINALNLQFFGKIKKLLKNNLTNGNQKKLRIL